jgi:uncharacterized damage-inducible protein DinB
MKSNSMISMYKRAFGSLRKEIEAYPDDSSLWQVSHGVNNSAGNLCLHLEGSLNHFIGNILGKTGYVRNRDAEFTIKGLSKSELLNRIQDTEQMIEKVLTQLTDNEWQAEFPVDFAGKENAEFYIIYFCGHIQYHMGQINYLRRILTHS